MDCRIATYAAGEVQFLEKLEPKDEWEARNAVLRRHVPRRSCQWMSPRALARPSGSWLEFQPPPKASISATLACRRLDSTVSAVSSLLSRVVCAVITLL